MPNAKPWWQFSLRHFLFVVLIAGPLAGLIGPPLVRSLFEWSPDAEVQSRPVHAHPDEMGNAGYFESAETPLD